MIKFDKVELEKIIENSTFIFNKNKKYITGGIGLDSYIISIKKDGIPYISYYAKSKSECVEIVCREDFFSDGTRISYYENTDILNITYISPIPRNFDTITIHNFSTLVNEEVYFSRNTIENLLINQHHVQVIIDINSKARELIILYNFKRDHPFIYFIKKLFGKL